MAELLACRLALMAWERNQKVFVITDSISSIEKLSETMWEYPQGRFLPHTKAEDPEATKAPVNIGLISSLKPTDVVINLCNEAVPQPERFARVLEIVPQASDKRVASREKFKNYRNLGLSPRTHEINK
jgi:DNA polymerase-3 subunit chi